MNHPWICDLLMCSVFFGLGVGLGMALEATFHPSSSEPLQVGGSLRIHIESKDSTL